MLKVLFAVLLLANAGLFAWQRGHLDSVVPSGREPDRMARQLNADRLKLVPPPQKETPPPQEPAVPEPGPAATPAPVPAPQPAEKAARPAPASSGGERAPVLTPAADRKPEAPPPAHEPEVLACVEIGDFDAEQAKRFGARVAELNLGNRMLRKPLLEPSSWVVHIPPQPDKEAVERKAGELRRLGVEDFFIILDNSPLRWGISLGVFRQESAARAHLAVLGEKGVRSARITPRMSPTGETAFQFRKLAPQEKTALDRIAAGFEPRQTRHCEG